LHSILPNNFFQYFEIENGKIMPKKKDFNQNCFERRYLSKTFPRRFLQVAKIALNKEKIILFILGLLVFEKFKIIN